MRAGILRRQGLLPRVLLGQGLYSPKKWQGWPKGRGGRSKYSPRGGGTWLKEGI